MKFISLTTRLMLVATLALALSATPSAAQQTPDFGGHWEGGIQTPNGDLGINVDFLQAEDGSWTGDISIPAQGLADFPLAELTVDGGAISFMMADIPGDPVFEGKLSEDGKTISGPFKQSGAELTFSLTRSDP